MLTTALQVTENVIHSATYASRCKKAQYKQHKFSFQDKLQGGAVACAVLTTNWSRNGTCSYFH